jgi:hypothetical protein
MPYASISLILIANAARREMVPDLCGFAHKRNLASSAALLVCLAELAGRHRSSIMSDIASTAPAHAVSNDAAKEKAPDPRRHYASPEDLREDIDLDLELREELLRQWMKDLDQRQLAEAEGMSASDPIPQEKEAQLASEHRRVGKSLEEIVAERQQRV